MRISVINMYVYKYINPLLHNNAGVAGLTPPAPFDINGENQENSFSYF
jgi:hypothetical protein